jgi:hypothetical protein
MATRSRTRGSGAWILDRATRDEHCSQTQNTSSHHCLLTLSAAGTLAIPVSVALVCYSAWLCAAMIRSIDPIDHSRRCGVRLARDAVDGSGGAQDVVRPTRAHLRHVRSREADPRRTGAVLCVALDLVVRDNEVVVPTRELEADEPSTALRSRCMRVSRAAAIHTVGIEVCVRGLPDRCTLDRRGASRCSSAAMTTARPQPTFTLIASDRPVDRDK